MTFRKKIRCELYVSLKLEKIMKANYMAASACILTLAACSKAELGEGVSAPRGETVTLTVPQTKAALDGDILKFEGDETIYAVASNGSTATLTAQDNSGKFTGKFSDPVTDGSTISLYCHNVEGTETFAQNGKPWLQSLDNSFTRTEDREISLTATLTAPAGVRAVAFITDGTDIESLEFHTKSGAKFTTFDGSTFGGEAVSAQKVVTNRTGYTNSTIFNVPDGLEGGYWIKAVKGNEAMYKSYSSSTAVTQDSKIEVKEFVPASVTVNAEFSGFQTSYSYYAGIDGVQKNITTANGMKNSEIKNGTVTITPKFSGVSSKLVNFKSIELLLNGTKVGEAKTTAAESYTFSVPEATEWGEKKFSVKVTYTIFGGAEISAESVESTTRQITGLPYSVNFNKSTKQWVLDGCTLNDNNIKIPTYHKSAKLSFSIPNSVSVTLKLFNGTYVYGGNTKLNVTIGSQTTNAFKNDNWKAWYDKTYGEYNASGSLSNSDNFIALVDDSWVASYYSQVPGLSVSYK